MPALILSAEFAGRFLPLAVHGAGPWKLDARRAFR